MNEQREFFEGVIARARAAVASGQLDVSDAAGLVTRHLACDQQGTIWSVGFSSGAWYRYAAKTWHRDDAGPQTFADRDGDLAARSVLAFVLDDPDPLPEPISEPAPPAPPAAADARGASERTVHEQGMYYWAEPDPSQPVAGTFPPGARVSLLEERGAWALIEGSGLRGWVDGRELR